MKKPGGTTFVLVLTCLVLTAVSGRLVFAQSAEEVTQLEEQISERQAVIDDINRKLEEYRKKIQSYSSQSASLYNDIALIENQTAMAELDIAATQNEIEAENLHLASLEERIAQETQRLEKQRALLGDMLFALHQQESRGVLASVLGASTFHEAFDAVAQIEEVNDNLQMAVDATKQAREGLEADKAQHEAQRETLYDLEAQLAERVEKFEHQKTAKEVLAMQTANSEAEYRTLMSELRQEQQYISSQITALQSEIEQRLSESGVPSDDPTTLSWPLTGIITATFHDPTYPFRHLFPHSGLDIAVSAGTSIKAASSGYVAWARTGTSYGNYVMIIHSDGLATLYAHMMRIDVAQDQFVARGQQIGLSGGVPGMQGAGLSTGAHLHFEVRKDGIPVDPQLYLAQ